MIFTRRFVIVLAIEVLGFAGAIVLVGMKVPAWVPPLALGVTVGITIWAVMEAAEGKL